MTGAAALGLGLLTLAGCEVSGDYFVDCTTFPPAPHQDQGVARLVIDVPPEVEAGATFTLTVGHVGVGAGPWVDPPTATDATLAIAGGASPSGVVALGSPLAPVTWPQTVSVTATGAPGETIDIGLDGAGSTQVFPTGISRLSCTTPAATAPRTQIPIVAAD